MGSAGGRCSYVHWPVPHFVARDEATGIRDVEGRHLVSGEPRQISGVTAVISTDHDHQTQVRAIKELGEALAKLEDPEHEVTEAKIHAAEGLIESTKKKVSEAEKAYLKLKMKSDVAAAVAYVELCPSL